MSDGSPASSLPHCLTGSLLTGGSLEGEVALHRIDPDEIDPGIVINTARRGGQLEAAPRIGVARGRPAQVDEGGHVLLLLERSAEDAPPRQRPLDLAIEIGRGHFDGVAGDGAGVQAVEPARAPVVPGAVLDHDMVVDAVALRVTERRIRDLVHPYRG